MTRVPSMPEPPSARSPSEPTEAGPSLHLARELEEARARLALRERQQAAVVSLGSTALRAEDMSALFAEAVAVVSEVLDTPLCKVLELRPDRGDLLLRAGVGWHEGLAGAAAVPGGLDSQAGYTLKSRAPVVVRDLTTESRFSGPALLHDHGVVSGLSVVIGTPDAPWGVLGAHTRSRRDFSAEDINFLQAIAHMLWAAIRQRRISTELARSMSRLEMALEAGHMGIWDWNLIDGTVGWSLEHYEILGLSPDEAEAGYRSWRARVHPDDLERVEAAIEDSRESGAPYRTEYRIVRPDGEVRWVEARGRHQVDGAGNAISMSGVLLDVDERKRAQMELGISEERLRVALENAPLMMFHSDAELRYTWVMNTHPGLPRSELVGRIDAEIFAAEPARLLADLKREVLRSGHGKRAEVTLDADAGIVMDVSVEPVSTADGRVCGLIGAALDVSEARRVRRTLEEASRQKDEFLALLGHELRNPLAAVTTAIDMLQHPPGAEAFRDAVAMIERQSRQLRRLVDDLLHVSRITRGDIDIRPKAIRLDPVLANLRQVILARSDRRDLVLDLPEEPLWPYVDPSRLDQIVGNLLSNAMKYSSPGSEIRLSAREEGDLIAIRIADRGVGMDPATLAHVFDPFVRASGRVDDPEHGLGIGLTLVKKLVDLHGGSVTAESPGLGEGSTFLVLLPAATKEQIAAAQLAAPGPRADRQARDSLRILVIDDNLDLSDGLSLLLERAGHQVRTVHSGEDGLAVASEWLPDAVILDIGLPDLDGHEVAARLRHAGGGPRIVALSGFTPQDSAGDLFDRYLVKPVEIGELLDALEGSTSG